MASLRAPGLGPIVGHTTDTTCRIWIRAGDPADSSVLLDENRRTIGVIGMVTDPRAIGRAWYFRLPREFDRTGTFQLGAKLGLGVRLLSAEGFSEDVRTGSALLAVPSLSLGPELRLRLSARISFGAEVAGEWMAIRQSFSVDGVRIADLGRFRGNAQLSLIFFVL